MEYKLTSVLQHSKKCKDKKRRNFLLWFLNDVLILKQKCPYDESYSIDSQYRTSFTNCYLLNGTLYQTRNSTPFYFWGGSKNHNRKLREVKYPVSKEVLAQFEIPKDFKIEKTKND